MATKGAHGLQLDQDLPFQRRNWSIERAARVIMGLAVLAAIAGVFGVGPSSNARSTSTDGRLSVEYQRFARARTPVTLRMEFSEKAAQQGQIRVRIDRAYLEKMKVERILPEPEKVEVAGDALVYVFPVTAGGAGAVSFDMKPDGAGIVKGNARVEGSEDVRLRHLVYP